MTREKICLPHRLTQHKRFVPEGTHPNFCFAKTSFMLESLVAIAGRKKMDKGKTEGKIKMVVVRIKMKVIEELRDE